jgi:hypothetical protein
MFVIKLPLLVESRRVSSFHNLLYYNHYFRKCFELVYRKCGYSNFSHR